MIAGLNTDVTHDGVSYHVQTEDLGEKNPIILTLVYRRGAIVLREQHCYAEIPCVQPPTAAIETCMHAQHRRVVLRVAAGLIYTDPAPPTEATSSASWTSPGPVTPPPSKPVDDLIQEYLRVRRRTKSH